MAGHSKWANIKHKKKINDQKKSKLFSKLTNNIKSLLKNQETPSNANKLKNAIDNAINKNLNKNIIKKIIAQNKKNNEQAKILLTFENKPYLLIIEVISDEKKTNILELKNTLKKFNFEMTNTNNNYEKFCEIKINKIYYNEKQLCFSLNKNFKIINFVDNIINIKNTNKLNLLNEKISNISISFKILMKNYIDITNKEQDRLDLMLKKLKKKTFITNIYINIKNNF